MLLPGALGLSVILGSLVLLPPILRWAARRTRRAPIGIRLATISVAREPLRPAAVMTLLAFSVGAVVFANVTTLPGQFFHDGFFVTIADGGLALAHPLPPPLWDGGFAEVPRAVTFPDGGAVVRCNPDGTEPGATARTPSRGATPRSRRRPAT